MNCPTCGQLLEEVVQPSDSPLNVEQWDVVRCGDYYCDHCRQYWWKSLVKSQKQSDYSLRPKTLVDHTDEQQTKLLTSLSRKGDRDRKESDEEIIRRVGYDPSDTI